MRSPPSPLGVLRTLLLLGRVSNLPTVWSNCVAAWWLGGGGPASRLLLLLGGATLLYTGGMFLNDAFDARFDRQHRPERPIPAGRISRRTVGWLAAGLLALGWGLLAWLSSSATCFATLLLGAIVLYNAVHKQTSLAPLLMATCRFLLYLVAASSAKTGTTLLVVASALALASYIAGLSFLARHESTGTASPRWPILLLLLPGFLWLKHGPAGGVFAWAAFLAFAIWLAWCLRAALVPGRRKLSAGVPAFLAGIALVDWLAVGAAEPVFSVVMVGLFLLALALQRLVPAS